MEKPSKDVQKLTQNWVNEVGVEQPSPSFVNDVMKRIELNTAKSGVYKPLVSKKAWVLVTTVVIGGIILLFLYPTGEPSYVQAKLLEEVSKVKNPFRGVEISKTLMYAVGCLALFLIQVPFLI